LPIDFIVKILLSYGTGEYALMGGKINKYSGEIMDDKRLFERFELNHPANLADPVKNQKR